MKAIALATALATFLGVASAAPAPADLFALKTVSSDPRFNGKCVSTYHTGAGTADATLYPCSGNSSKIFYMKGRQILTTVYDESGSSAHGGVQAAPGISYDDWYPVTIDIVEAPTKDFSYSASKGFLVEGQYGFIVCNWSHSGASQLFVLAQAASATPLLKNCGFVKLVKG